MNNIVLDASALLALIKDEPGAAIVEQLLCHNIVMSAINVSEVAAVLLYTGMPENECRRSIETFVNTVVVFDTELSLITATLKKDTKHKGISFGDRACFALGMKLKAPVYTVDRIWADLQISNLNINLIR